MCSSHTMLQVFNISAPEKLPRKAGRHPQISQISQIKEKRN
jgi:hypothetical protein